MRITRLQLEILLVVIALTGMFIPDLLSPILQSFYMEHQFTDTQKILFLAILFSPVLLAPPMYFLFSSIQIRKHKKYPCFGVIYTEKTEMVEGEKAIKVANKLLVHSAIMVLAGVAILYYVIRILS